MLREPAEVSVDDQGRVELPLGLLAEAGISPGTGLVAFSDGDGRIVLRRAEDAFRDLVEKGTL
ncbi:MAG: AbrB/MazE/SpoVT family DNA-binding domain-containing protein [Streptomyces sp.]|nr:AbrB/MazE/SpoVT family DNA-binding domain-containing protein [Streptomyces sp.]